MNERPETGLETDNLMCPLRVKHLAKIQYLDPYILAGSCGTEELHWSFFSQHGPRGYDQAIIVTAPVHTTSGLWLCYCADAMWGMKHTKARKLSQ